MASTWKVEDRLLPVKLTAEEIVQACVEVAEAISDLRAVEAEAKVAVQEAKERVLAAKEHLEARGRVVELGEENRYVSCEERLEGNVVRLVRLDTEGVVSTRPATAGELQLELGDES